MNKWLLGESKEVYDKWWKQGERSIQWKNETVNWKLTNVYGSLWWINSASRWGLPSRTYVCLLVLIEKYLALDKTHMMTHSKGTEFVYTFSIDFVHAFVCLLWNLTINILTIIFIHVIFTQNQWRVIQVYRNSIRKFCWPVWQMWKWSKNGKSSQTQRNLKPRSFWKLILAAFFNLVLACIILPFRFFHFRIK